MAYRRHLLIQFGGRLYGTETWSCNLRMLIGSATGGNPLSATYKAFANDNLADIAADIRAHHVNTGAKISPGAVLDYCKVNPIGADGRYEDKSNTIVHYYGTNSANGAGAHGPPQCSVVVSLMTAAARGRANRGRIYPPTGAVTMGSDGRVNATDVNAMALAYKLLFDNLNNRPGPDLQNPRIVVASAIGDDGPGGTQEGPTRDVLRVGIGNVVDTQMRRRVDLVEAYTYQPVVIT